MVRVELETMHPIEVERCLLNAALELRAAKRNLEGESMLEAPIEGLLRDLYVTLELTQWAKNDAFCLWKTTACTRAA